MAFRTLNGLQEVHIWVDLIESVDQITCKDFLKIIKVARRAKGKVFFGIHSKQLRLDVPENYAQDLSRALRERGFHGAVSDKAIAQNACFLVEERHIQEQ